MRLTVLLIFLYGEAINYVACNEKRSTDCGNLSDCVAEKPNICALDKQNVCFKYFDSLCHLEYEQCKQQLEYLIYLDKYCENDAFRCIKEKEDFSEAAAVHL
ncbi:uncharacterized protein LOC129242818 [Anastrepha obliqua]|uniref:uncharacterized protein LOC129242818 n=1 Tax=Anastrepha obliqua TaxID=95512 RepID=UPI002409D078|nr:uncharacterized protein LOC129242818 [Anastrepha obliqua]